MNQNTHQKILNTLNKSFNAPKEINKIISSFIEDDTQYYIGHTFETTLYGKISPHICCLKIIKNDFIICFGFTTNVEYSELNYEIYYGKIEKSILNNKEEVLKLKVLGSFIPKMFLCRTYEGCSCREYTTLHNYEDVGVNLLKYYGLSYQEFNVYDKDESNLEEYKNLILNKILDDFKDNTEYSKDEIKNYYENILNKKMSFIKLSNEIDDYSDFADYNPEQDNFFFVEGYCTEFSKQSDNLSIDLCSNIREIQNKSIKEVKSLFMDFLLDWRVSRLPSVVNTKIVRKEFTIYKKDNKIITLLGCEESGFNSFKLNYFDEESDEDRYYLWPEDYE